MKYGSRTLEKSIEAIANRKDKKGAWYELQRLQGLISASMSAVYEKCTQRSREEIDDFISDPYYYVNYVEENFEKNKKYYLDKVK